MQTDDWMVGGKSGHEEDKLISHFLILFKIVPKHDLMLLTNRKTPDKNMSSRTVQNLVTYVYIV
jgi:hypothetical protein